MLIRPEISNDIIPIFNVTNAAFSTDMEARLIDMLRADGDLSISLVAEEAGKIVGHIALSPMHAPVRALGLGPVAVYPKIQKQGIGSKLIRASLEIAENEGYRAVFLLGHAEYYPRFGFRADLAAQFQSPYASPNFMAKELEAGCLSALTGSVNFAPAFSRV